MQRTVSDNTDRVAAEAMMRDIIAMAAATHPHPNPRVGAGVISASGQRLGLAVHHAAGEAHAEATILSDLSEAARGGTLVVSLEPCNHHGRTPPCTDAIIEAGIAAVYVGAMDPDERVAGSGVARLLSAGIDVHTGVLTEEAEALDPGYFHHRRTGRPMVTLKAATTLDGQVAAADGTSQWITSPEARSDAHALRSRSDAVIVGAGTLRADNPRLDVRIPGYEGPQPRPVIIAGTRPLPTTSSIWDRDPLVYGMAAETDLVAGEYVSAAGPDGTDLSAVIKDLGSRGFIDVLVEGGPTLARSLLESGSVDRLVAYVAASLAGGVGSPMFAGPWSTLDERRPITITSVHRVGPDLRIDALMGTGGDA